MYSAREPLDSMHENSYNRYIELNKRMAVDMDAILKGANPGDIPFYAPTKFELSINLKAAKVLSLTVPATLLTAADVVIE